MTCAASCAGTWVLGCRVRHGVRYATRRKDGCREAGAMCDDLKLLLGAATLLYAIAFVIAALMSTAESGTTSDDEATSCVRGVAAFVALPFVPLALYTGAYWLPPLLAMLVSMLAAPSILVWTVWRRNRPLPPTAAYVNQTTCERGDQRRRAPQYYRPLVTIVYSRAAGGWVLAPTGQDDG